MIKLENDEILSKKLMATKEEVVKKLIKDKITITTMESCTGGALISTITDVEGASNITEGGFVTYSNKQKIRTGVPTEIIEKYGVYSEETAVKMAEVCKAKMNAVIGIGITGTLSNVDPNNKDSVQGEVYFCIKYLENTEIVRKIKVPIECRHEQKIFIVNSVFEELNKLL
ncbi:MAG: CinA family protein [Clostridium sp.]|nr:CinA family protein [Clostridium sp.]